MPNVKAIFLPPAPHTGAFFKAIRSNLSHIETRAMTYPGYGDMPAGPASIQAYAAALLLLEPAPQILVGFHTGCLVALEMAAQRNNTSRLILIDIPYFDAQTKSNYASKLDAHDPKLDAFRAAFAYDAEAAFAASKNSVTAIATQSSLFEATISASKQIENCTLIERRDIEKPAMESPAMTDLLAELLAG